VFENRVLRRIFGLKGEEVTGVWRKLHNKNGHVKEDEVGRTCSKKGETRNAYRYWRKPRRRWVDNIKMDLREMGREVMDYIDLAPLDGSFEHGDETSGSIKCWLGSS
jgi:hypothetical protein